MTTDEALIEQAIQQKGLNAPRLTPGDIDAQIVQADYHVFNGVLTVCALTLQNGYMVTGESACASPENYDEEIGRKIAYDQARNKIWALEGYRLRTSLHTLEQMADLSPDEMAKVERFILTMNLKGLAL